MYYFIFEQAKNKWQAAFQNKISAFLEELQIVGEMVKANPIQKPEELFQIGIKKGYGTIVAVGTDSMINFLSAQTAKFGITLGIIPIEAQSSFFQLIGSQTWEEAAEALPKRRVETFDLGQVGKNDFFLTYIKIQPEGKNKLAQLILNFYRFKIEVPTLQITIANGILEPGNFKLIRESFSDGFLDIIVPVDASQIKSPRILQIFQKESQGENSSLFHTRKVKVESQEKNFLIKSPDDKIITRTPTTISIIPQAIRLIIKKAVGAKNLTNL